MILSNLIDLELKWMDSLSRHLPEIINYIALFFTEFGGQIVLIGIIGILYWCVNKEVGERIGFIAICSLVVNNILKGFVNEKRPYQHQDYEHLQQFPGKDGSSGSTSFPSGHSQNSGSIYILTYRKSKWTFLKVLSLVLLILVPISRVILGVHFPHDVIVGSLLGVSIAIIMDILMIKYGKYQKYFYFASLLCFLPFVIFVPTKDLLVGYGLLLGLVLGTMIEKKYIKFSVDVPLFKKFIRIIIGIIVLLITKDGIKAIYLLFYEESSIPYILDGLRYFLIAFIATGVIPFIFTNEKRRGI